LNEIKNLLHTYILPSMTLLAFDLANGVKRNDFLSFAIQRNPDFDSNHSNWLPNGIGLGVFALEGKDLSISYRPIQKFIRYDAIGY
jgi:hypothetical protein